MMKDRLVNTGKIKHQVREYTNSAEAIIFLHYGGGNMMMWQDVVPLFQEDFHILLIDMRGHGRSDRPKDNYHIDDMAEDILGVMDALGLGKVHVVGSSLGAEVGLSLAANHPNRVLSLVCEGALFNESGPYGLWEGAQDTFKAYAQEKLEKLRNRPEKTYNSIDELVTEKKQFFTKHGWWNETMEAVVRYDAIEREDGKFVESWGRITLQYTKHYLYYNFGDYYQRVQCPVLMMPDEIPGQDEKELSIMNALFHLVKHGKIVRVPGWVHPFGWMITPQAGSLAVRSFLEETPT